MEKIRLQKFIADAGLMSRRAAEDEIERGNLSVNGHVATLGTKIDPRSDVVTYKGKRIRYERREHTYIMLNKPEGTISSTEDSERTVMKLLPPEYERAGCFPCGRLDVDTVGLLLITNDGDTAHALLSPKRHVAKSYRFRCSEPLDEDMIRRLEEGVDLGDFKTAPARLEMDNSNEGVISISEGKFHQIKRMLASVGSGIEFLERIKFGPLELDGSLERGSFRELTEEEIAQIDATFGEQE